MTRTLRFSTYHVEVSNEDKAWFRGGGITKGEVVEYYRDVAPVMLSFLRGRPITMERYPDGIEEDGFYQRNAPEHFPGWIERARLEKEGGTVEQAVCRRAADLVYMVNQGCITPHAWLSRAESPWWPDIMVFDLDPPGDDFPAVRAAAHDTREVLSEVGLATLVQTSGSRGLHIVVPLDGSSDFDEVREFAQGVAEVLVLRAPAARTTEQYKANRGSRIFIDTLRNSYGQSFAAPYSVRTRPGAPVAMPVDWDELEDVHPKAFTIRNARDRIADASNPWKGMRRRARSLREPRKRLEGMLEELRRR